MTRILLALPVLFAAIPAMPATTAKATALLRADEHRTRAVEVAPWDPSSPQRLVRLDGTLYQEQAGWYHPATDTISVRLGEGVVSWSDLLSAAAAKSPSFEALSRLELLRVNRLGIADLSIPAGSDPEAWCDLVFRTGLVRYAEVATIGRYGATQSDPQYPDQWALNNTGQTGGTPGVDINAEAAWDLTAGDASIVVAVLDSGTDIDHEDLAVNVWHNTGEIPDNGVDDDGNGFVDDWEGWDFDNGDNDPRASFYHGTHVTGIVNAAGSNGVGIAGVAGGLGGPGVQTMALNVGNFGPNNAIVDDAILYAADNGAHVITLSLSIGETQAINDALDYALNTKNVFIDCASGNNGSSVAYPATRPEAMAVGSTDHNDLGSGFSNPGPEVEVVAPGSNVLSTQIGDTYGTSDGTSFAAPQVAGLAALILSRNPGLLAGDVRQMIVDTAVDVDVPGFDNKTGNGRIDAFAALSLAQTSDATITLDEAGYACGDQTGVSVSDFDLAGAGSVTITARSDGEPGGEVLTLEETGSGSGLFRGSIALDDGPLLPDGLLQVASGDTITVEYLDADDGAGGLDVLKTDQALVDCDAPLIQSVQVGSFSDTSATVSWVTDEPANSLVRFGETPPPSLSVAEAALSTTHAVTLTGLAPCTTYSFEVESSDGESNTTVADNGGSYFTFDTYGNFPGDVVAPCHQGQVSFVPSGSFGCDSQADVSLIDIDLDTDPGLVETVDVLVTSSSEPAGEWISLMEVTAQNTRFEGGVQLDPGAAVAGDGLLSVGAGDLITVTYRDLDDGEGGSFVATATSSADCTAPFISDLTVSEISASRAVVEWTTEEPATSRVEFGGTTALGSSIEEPALVTSHRVAISPFDPCDTVYFRVVSADAHGVTRVTDAGGIPLSFNLNQIGGLVYYENFETDSGWTLPGDWERATPIGLGTQNGDPQSAWSGTRIIGNDLTGLGTFPGDYEPNSSASALSPVFETRQQRNLELIVRRRLGVTTADEAGIYVITSGTDLVWTSNFSFNDDQWEERQYDISALADNKQSVRLEFRMEAFGPDHSFGWNVDEVIIKDATEPDYLACGACSGAPAFLGVRSVEDPDPCGPGGLLIGWETAAAWGTGSGGSYDIHRGATPDFVPDTLNRIATGVTGTSWTDVTAPVDTPVWYAVRARNDESCAGGEGLADGNLVRLGASETTSRPLPGPVGGTLAADPVGSAHVRLEWAPATGADHYRILRGEARDGADLVQVGTTGETVFEDVGAVGGAPFYVYRVVAVDACGRQE